MKRTYFGLLGILVFVFFSCQKNQDALSTPCENQIIVDDVPLSDNAIKISNLLKNNKLVFFNENKVDSISIVINDTLIFWNSRSSNCELTKSVDQHTALVEERLINIGVLPYPGIEDVRIDFLFRTATAFHEEERALKKNYELLELYRAEREIMPQPNRSPEVSIPFNENVVHHFETYFYHPTIELNNKVHYNIYETVRAAGIVERFYISFDQGIIGIKADPIDGVGISQVWTID